MGASGWHYFTEYDADPKRALRKLRKAVFMAGDYIGPGGRVKFDAKRRDPRPRPSTIQALLEAQGETGTHSILDIACFEGEPRKKEKIPDLFDRGKGFVEIDASLGGECMMAPLDAVKGAYGTEQPTRAQVEANRNALQTYAGRFGGVCFVVWNGERPEALFFTGYSGD